MNAQERLDYLLGTEWVPTNRQVIVADIIAAVGLESSRIVLGTLQAASAQDPVLAAAYQALVTVGVSISGADRQAMLDTLATVGSWTNEVRNAIKALGGVDRPRWQIEGYESEPTLAAATRDVLRDSIRAKTTAMVGWLDALNVSSMTVAEVEAYVADLLESDDGNPSQGGE